MATSGSLFTFGQPASSGGATGGLFGPPASSGGGVRVGDIEPTSMEALAAIFRSPASSGGGGSGAGSKSDGKSPLVTMTLLTIEVQDKVRIQITLRNNIVKVISSNGDVKVMGDYTSIAVEKLADGVIVPEINCAVNEVKIVGGWFKLGMTTTTVMSDMQTISTIMFSNSEQSPAKKQRAQ